MDSINQGSKIFGKRMGGMVQVIEQVQGPEFNPRYSTKKYRGKKLHLGLVVVVYTCNPSYLGGRDKGEQLEIGPGKKLVRP
jgi:hypothetical protein